MREQYQVTLHSQMGPRVGRLTLQFEGTVITGFLELVGYRNAVQGVQAEDGRVHLFHSIQTAVRTLPCETVLGLREGRLTGLTTAKPCRMRWDGIQLFHEP